MQPNPFDGMEPEAVIRKLQEEANNLEANARRLEESLTEANASASSPDGAVTVSVSPNGALLNVTFSAKAKDVSPQELGPLVMRTVRAAQRQASARVTEAIGAQLDDPAAMDFLRSVLPQPEPEVEPQPVRRDDDDGMVLRKRRAARPNPGSPSASRRDDDEPPGSILR